MDLPDQSVERNDRRGEPKPSRRPIISYAALVWTIFVFLTIFACVDRFTTNFWPRQTHRIGRGFAGSDKIDGLKEGPWTVKFYDIVARISGRYSILALNLLFFTMMKSTASFLSESWAARNLVDMSNIVDANLCLHKWNGITLVVMTLVHVWSILMPPIFNGWRAQVLAGSFEWILSERKPAGFKDINVAESIVSLQVDDVFRIVEMTLLLAILMPLSIKWLSTRWHLGIHAHRFIAIIYYIDIVRRHTHPHSWFLNTPFFIAWLVDNAVGVCWRRQKPEIFRLQLSDDYILVFWNQMIRSNTVGPKYYLRLVQSSILEQAHTFTGFENRRNLNLAEGRLWSVCLLIRVYNNKRHPRLGRKDKVSHTRRVAEATDLAVYTWGPFHGSMSENTKIYLEDNVPLTLVAGGSAAGYLLDALQQYDGISCTPLTVLYTCRDVGLFRWIVKVLLQLMRSNVCEFVNILIAVTDGGTTADQEIKDMVMQKQRNIDEGLETFSSSESDGGKGSLRVQYGRINFVKEIPGGNVVFFQGSGGLQGVVGKACKMNDCKLVAGPTFDQDRSKKRNTIIQALRHGLFRRDTNV